MLYVCAVNPGRMSWDSSNLKQQDMKRVKRICLLAAVTIAAGCNMIEWEEEGSGTIILSIQNGTSPQLKGSGLSPDFYPDGVIQNLDTNKFQLSIYSDKGLKVYDGKYGKKPNEFVVIPGSYDIKLYSTDFHAPAFDTPLLGDEQTIVVDNDMSVNVKLACRQLNGGIRLNFTDEFKRRFPGAGLELRDINGSIGYPYTSGRYCYVQPGAIELYYRGVASDTLLCTRQIAGNQMLSLKLSYAPGNRNSSSITLSLDTTRFWNTESFNVGHRIPTGAYTIEQAKEMVGEKNVTVFGFVLGGDASENAMRIAPPFTSKSNIIIAPSMLERNRDNCFVVELPSGSVRDGLNLVAFPENLGKAVLVTGNIVESYYGYIGIKGTKAYTILY